MKNKIAKGILSLFIVAICLAITVLTVIALSKQTGWKIIGLTPVLLGITIIAKDEIKNIFSDLKSK